MDELSDYELSDGEIEFVLNPSLEINLVGKYSSDTSSTELTDQWLSSRESGSLLNIVVKNTFIDGYIDDGEDEGMPVCAAKTCPLLRMPIPSSDFIETAPRWGAALTRLGEAKGDSDSSDGSSFNSLPPAASLTALTSRDVSISQGVRARLPEASVGSVNHYMGGCKPCAWFWRPQGCSNGQDCRHCHLCPQGELRARRKSKEASACRKVPLDRAVSTLEPRSAGSGRRALELTRLV